MNLAIAEITLNPETKRITNIGFLKNDLRFKCQRCAVFCCRLGGPKLNVKDLQRLEKAGYKPEIYVDNTKKKGDNEQFMKEKEDGSCGFLKYSNESKNCECTIYEFRPTVCRLYPFEFSSTSHNTGILRIIPCCNGLNASDGKLVDREFIEKNLLEAIIHSIKN